MSNVPPIYCLSSPKRVTADLLYIYDFLGLDFKKLTSRNKKFKQTLAEAEEAVDEELKGRMKRNQLLSEFTFANLHKLKGKIPVFTPGISSDMLLEVEGAPGRVGFDPVSQLYYQSEEQLKIAQAIKESGHDANRVFNDFSFNPISPLLFPYVIKYDTTPYLIHAFPYIFGQINTRLSPVAQFISLEKRLEDREPKKGNYQFSAYAFDLSHLKQIMSRNPSMFSGDIKDRFGGSKEDFLDDLHINILVNLDIMRQIYTAAVQELELKEAVLFSQKTSFAADIFDKLGIPVKNIIGKPKKISNLAERDPTHLNKLYGFITAVHAQRTGEFIRYQKPAPRQPAPLLIPPQDFSPCWAYQFFKCERGSWCTQAPPSCAKHSIDSLTEETRESLTAFTRSNHFGIKPIESFVHLLNKREYELWLPDGKRHSWVKEKWGRTVKPAKLEDRVYSEYDLRASSFGTDCGIAMMIAQIDTDMLPITVVENEMAKQGIAIHAIMNQGDVVHQEILNPVGNFKRSDYCEKQLLYSHKPTAGELDCAFSKLAELDYPVIPRQNPVVKVSGHPDCCALLTGENTADPVILDIKRSMYIPQTRWSFVKQTLTYALALEQRLKLHPENYYTMLIQTPFDENRARTEEEIILGDELYRDQRLFMMKIPKNSELVKALKQELTFRYLLENLILNSKQVFYQEKGRMQKSCDYCFENSSNSGVCDYLLGEMEKYDKPVDFLGSKLHVLANRSSQLV